MTSSDPSLDEQRDLAMSPTRSRKAGCPCSPRRSPRRKAIKDDPKLQDMMGKLEQVYKQISKSVNGSATSGADADDEASVASYNMAKVIKQGPRPDQIALPDMEHAAGTVLNPCKDDPELRRLLRRLDEIETDREFGKWKECFLQRFHRFLPGTGSEAAEATYQRFGQVVSTLVMLVYRLEGLLHSGELLVERGSVAARKCLVELSRQLMTVIYKLESLIPGTAEKEAKVGYTKFHMGAVLVRDGFKQYGSLSICDDILQHMKAVSLLDLADEQVMAKMNKYSRKLQGFCDVMADLGLYDAMLKCNDLVHVEDEEEEEEAEEAPPPVPEIVTSSPPATPTRSSPAPSAAVVPSPTPSISPPSSPVRERKKKKKRNKNGGAGDDNEGYGWGSEWGMKFGSTGDIKHNIRLKGQNSESTLTSVNEDSFDIVEDETGLNDQVKQMKKTNWNKFNNYYSSSSNFSLKDLPDVDVNVGDDYSTSSSSSSDSDAPRRAKKQVATKKKKAVAHTVTKKKTATTTAAGGKPPAAPSGTSPSKKKKKIIIRKVVKKKKMPVDDAATTTAEAGNEENGGNTSKTTAATVVENASAVATESTINDTTGIVAKTEEKALALQSSNEKKDIKESPQSTSADLTDAADLESAHDDASAVEKTAHESPIREPQQDKEPESAQLAGQDDIYQEPDISKSPNVVSVNDDARSDLEEEPDDKNNYDSNKKYTIQDLPFMDDNDDADYSSSSASSDGSSASCHDKDDDVDNDNEAETEVDSNDRQREFVSSPPSSPRKERSSSVLSPGKQSKKKRDKTPAVDAEDENAKDGDKKHAKQARKKEKKKDREGREKSKDERKKEKKDKKKLKKDDAKKEKKKRSKSKTSKRKMDIPTLIETTSCSPPMSPIRGAKVKPSVSASPSGKTGTASSSPVATTAATTKLPKKKIVLVKKKPKTFALPASAGKATMRNGCDDVTAETATSTL